MSDDPHRTRVLVSHHLEHSKRLHEQGDFSITSGSYNGTPLAVASTGLGKENVLTHLSELIKLGASKVVYISTCISTTVRHDIRSVILAAGGSKELIDLALAAAGRIDATEQLTIATVLHPDGTHLDGVHLDGVHSGDGGIVDEASDELYKLAQEKEIEALSILTVSENTITGEKMEKNEVISRLYPASRLVFEMFALPGC